MSSRVSRVLVLTLAPALVLILAIAAVKAAGSSTKPRLQGPAISEVRGLWVLRTSMTSPRSISEVIRTAVNGGYNTLLVQVRGRGDAYYRSPIEPRAAELLAQPSSFDPLATLLTSAHAAGLKVHAWFNVNLISSATNLPRSREHVVWRHPEWLMVPRALVGDLQRLEPRGQAYVDRLARWSRSQSDTVEGLFLSPITDEAQAYTVSVVRSLVSSYDIDGLHLDYTRYPTAEFDHSTAALNAFRSSRLSAAPAADRDRLDRESQSDPLIWTRTYPDAWTAFRADRLTSLVRRIRDAVKTARPGATLSSAVIPDPVDAREAHLQHWERWAQAGLLDVLCPMAYATESDAFGEQVAKAIAAGHGRPVWVGIGAWRLPVAQTAAHLALVRRTDAAGVLLFSYDSLLSGSPNGSYFTRLRSALLNPLRKPGRPAEGR